MAASKVSTALRIAIKIAAITNYTQRWACYVSVHTVLLHWKILNGPSPPSMSMVHRIKGHSTRSFGKPQRLPQLGTMDRNHVPVGTMPDMTCEAPLEWITPSYASAYFQRAQRNNKLQLLWGAS
jgi:hypothetical protein